MMRGKKWSIGFLIAGLAGTLFVVAAACMIIALNRAMKKDALVEAKMQARIILDRNLAIHSYFNKQLKPTLFPLLDSEIAKGYFESTWMSSTYAVREINKYSKTLSEGSYYYKECAINARSPENEADPYERAFIERVNSDPSVMEDSAVRTIAGKSYFAVLRRGEKMEVTCLRCHSTAAIAPSGLIRHYGGGRSFGRHDGEVVSAVSIRVPLETAFVRANRISLNLSLFLILVLSALYSLLLWLNKRLLFGPLHLVSHKAEQIAAGTASLAEVVPLPGGNELREFVAAFNTMTTKLATAHVELVANNELLNKIFSTTHVLLAYLDRDFRFIRVNEAYATAYGRQADAFSGKDFFALFPAPEREAVFRHVVATSRPYTAFADPFDCQEDGVSYWDWTLQPILDRAGKTEGLFFVSKDVTERKRAKEAVHKGEERYRLVFENSPVSIWEEDFSGVKAFFIELREDGVTDIETYFVQHPESIRQCAERVRIVDVNRTALDLHDARDKEELLAGLVSTFTPESFSTFREELVCLWNGGTGMIGDAVVKTLAGEPRQVTVYFSVCPGYEETLAKVVVSLVDVTERMRVEEALRESEARFRRLAENARDVIFRMSLPEGTYEYISPAVLELSGYEPEEFYRNPRVFFEFIHPDWRGYIQEERMRMLHGEIPPTYEFQIIHKSGGVRWVNQRNLLVRDDHGRPVAMEGIATDITERKRVEEELRQLNAQLDRRVKERTAELEKNNAELERLNRLFVGRELRMVELKKRLQELEK